MADLTFRIAAELGEVKAALADLKRQLAGAGTGTERTFSPVNEQIDKTAAKSRAAATEAEKLGRAQERAAQRAAAAQERATRAQEREAQRAARAQQRLVDEQERNSRRAAVRATAEQKRQADSVARQATQQQRQLAPQLTDIGVGLATGQSPLLVLLQQGGQLKDLFGGIVPAAKAVGGAVAALINPVTLLGGALAVVAIGYIKGGDEAARFRRIVAETGGVIGVTAGDLNDLAASLGNLSGSTRASAAETLASVAQAGKFAGEQIGIVARAAEQLRNSAGRDVATTVAEFSKIADDPVKGVDELNRRYGFLTGTLAAQIRTLQEQGRTQEASTLAMKAYAAAVDERTPKIRENLGLVERAWRAIKEGARSAGDAVLNIGREAGPRADFNRLFAERQQRQARLDNPQSLVDRSEQGRERNRARIDQINRQLQELTEAEAQAQRKATQSAAQQRAVAVQQQLADEARQFESSADRITRERTAVVNRSAQGLADAQIAADQAAADRIAADRDKQLAALAREAAKTPQQFAQANAAIVRDSTERGIEEVQRLYDRGLVSAADFFAKRRDLQLAAVEADLAAQRAELATTQEQGDVARIAAQIRVLERRKADVRRDAIRDEARATQALQEQLLEVDVGLQRDSLTRSLDALQVYFDRAEVATADFYAARQVLELAAIDQDLELVRKRLQSQELDPAARARLLAEEEKLQRARNDVRLRTVRDGEAAARDLQRTLDEARAQELDSKGRTAEAARIRLEAQFRDLLKRLERDGNEAGVRLIRGLIDTGVAKARFEELRRDFDKVSEDLRARNAEIDRGVQSGAINPASAEGLRRDAAANAASRLQGVNADLQDLRTRTNDPEIIAGVNRIGEAIAGIGDKARPVIEVIKGELRAALDQMSANFERVTVNAGVDALTNFFTDIASGAKTGKEALRDFVVSFAQSMAQIAARALATFLVLQLLDAIYPGLGRATAATMAAGSADTSASVFHSGGMVRRGAGPQRKVPAWAFAGAPRFHGGGMVGLKPDEVPAILQTGERVQSRQEVAAGAGQRQGVRIVNAVDPGVIQDAMSSAAGERVILNVIERNAGTVRQRLAG